MKTYPDCRLFLLNVRASQYAHYTSHAKRCNQLGIYLSMWNESMYNSFLDWHLYLLLYLWVFKGFLESKYRCGFSWRSISFFESWQLRGKTLLTLLCKHGRLFGNCVTSWHWFSKKSTKPWSCFYF